MTFSTNKDRCVAEQALDRVMDAQVDSPVWSEPFAARGYLARVARRFGGAYRRWGAEDDPFSRVRITFNDGSHIRRWANSDESNEPTPPDADDIKNMVEVSDGEEIVVRWGFFDF